MSNMNKYIRKLLAEMPESTPHDVVQNIMDELIPDEVKRRLLKPLLPRQPRPPPPPHRGQVTSQGAEEEGHAGSVWSSSTTKSQNSSRFSKRSLTAASTWRAAERALTFRQMPWMRGKYLRGWRMDDPKTRISMQIPKLSWRAFNLKFTENSGKRFRPLIGKSFSWR